MQITTSDLNYLDAVEAKHPSWCLHNRVAVCAVDARTSLPRAVKAPAPDTPVLVDGERVEAPCTDGNCTPPTRPENDALGICSVDLAPLENFTAKLALLARTPGENRASGR